MSAALTYGSVCSGMEAASLAWAPLGWRCAFVSEIDKAPCALLEQRFPDVPNFGDMTKFEDWPDVAIDLLVGGTPCQSFSLAGLRKGLADPRGNLMFTYGAIAKRLRPTWLLWENVPGVLSSNGGRDFGAFLGMLAELGYGFAYRVLDAQFFGLAQRRKRVFVVGHLGDWRAPAAVLFEPESLRGDPPPSRRAGERAAATVTSSSGGVSHKDDDAGRVVALDYTNGTIGGDLCGTLEAAQSKGNRGHGVLAFKASHFTRDKDGAPSSLAPPLSADADKGDQDTLVLAFSCKDHGADAGELAPTLRAMGHDGSHANAGGQLAIAFDARQSDVIQYGDMSGPLDTDQQSIGVLQRWAVRRLTPRECERLQGAPDDHTLVPYRGKPIADGPRYKMIGNSFAVNCVRWIGERIAEVHSLRSKQPIAKETTE